MPNQPRSKGIWSAKFWKSTAERAIKTAAQVAATISTGGVLVTTKPEVNAFLLDWRTIGGFALGGACWSVLTSVASEPFGSDDESPSLV